MWILVQKYDIGNCTVVGAVNNMTVVNRINEGIDDESGTKTNLAIDYDAWIETKWVLSKIPVQCQLSYYNARKLTVTA